MDPKDTPAPSSDRRQKKYSPYRDAIVVLATVTSACLLYWRSRGLTAPEVVKSTCQSVSGILGGPLTAWYAFVSWSLPVSHRLPPSDPRKVSIEGVFFGIILTALLCLPWVLYFRDPSRRALFVALGVWLTSGWFFTFGVWM
jgi:hypothetical protein